MRSALAALALGLALTGPARGQGTEPPATQSEFSERISVMAIEIPVRVLVDGRPVAGLTAENFRVLEDGAEHEIVGFEQVDLTPAFGGEAALIEAPAADAAMPKIDPMLLDGRRLLFLFDVAYSGRRPLSRAIDGARGLVERGLHGSDRVAVATYSGVHGLSFLTGFTADREKTLLALDVIRAGVTGGRKDHDAAARALAERGGLVTAGTPLERFRSLSEQFGQSAAIAFEEAEADLGVVAVGDGGAGGFDQPEGGRFGSSAASFDPVRSSYQNISPGQIAAGLAQGPGRSGVRSLSLELVEMATVLRDLPGQKHLFFFSQGFSSTLLEDATALHHLQKALEALRRANWAIQAIDIRGVGFSADSLFFLANETGGELIENHADVGRAATKLMARTAVSYVLTIQPTDVPADDRYRRLTVKLVDGPKRARVIHRPGYYTPKPRSKRNNLENTLDAAALLLSGREVSELAVEVLTLALPGRGLAEVPVVVEIPAAELGPAVRGGVLLEFHGYALDPAGEIQDLFSQRVRLSRQDVRDLLAERGGIRFFDRVALPPGEHTLRLLVRNFATGAAFLGTRPLSIAASLGAPGVHGPLFVAADDWALLRGEGSLNGGRGVEHPFVLAGRPRIPSPRPAIAAGASTDFFLKITRVEAPDLRIGARVLDADGQPAEGAELTFRERVMGADDRVEALIGSLSPGRLEPGSYRLELTATWDGGQGRSVGVGDFHVVAASP